VIAEHVAPFRVDQCRVGRGGETDDQRRRRTKSYGWTRSPDAVWTILVTGLPFLGIARC
jgi:hypothetical protein